MALVNNEIRRWRSNLLPCRTIHGAAHNAGLFNLPDVASSAGVLPASRHTQKAHKAMAELKQIGQYVLGETLGQGSFGKVKRLSVNIMDSCANTVAAMRAMWHNTHSCVVRGQAPDHRPSGLLFPSDLLNLGVNCRFSIRWL